MSPVCHPRCYCNDKLDKEEKKKNMWWLLTNLAKEKQQSFMLLFAFVGDAMKVFCLFVLFINGCFCHQTPSMWDCKQQQQKNRGNINLVIVRVFRFRSTLFRVLSGAASSFDHVLWSSGHPILYPTTLALTT